MARRSLRYAPEPHTRLLLLLLPHVPNENCRYVFGGMSTSVQSTTEAVQQEYIISAFTFPSMWRFSLTERR